MHWNRYAGMSKQITGQLKLAFGLLTGNKPAMGCGRRKVLEAKLQRYCAYSAEHARRVVDAWERRNQDTRARRKIATIRSNNFAAAHPHGARTSMAAIQLNRAEQGR